MSLSQQKLAASQRRLQAIQQMQQDPKFQQDQQLLKNLAQSQQAAVDLRQKAAQQNLQTPMEQKQMADAGIPKGMPSIADSSSQTAS